MLSESQAPQTLVWLDSSNVVVNKLVRQQPRPPSKAATVTMKSIQMATAYLLIFNSIVLCFAAPKDYAVFGKINDGPVEPTEDYFQRFHEMLKSEQDRATFQRMLDNYLQNKAMHSAQNAFPYDPNYPLEGQQPLTLDYVEPNNGVDYAQPEESSLGGGVGDTTNYLDRADNGVWLDGQVVPQITPLEATDSLKDDEVDAILLKYLYDQYIKTQGDEAKSYFANPFKEADDDLMDELNFEKRRQKIVIRDEKRGEQPKKEESGAAAAAAPSTTTARPVIKKMIMKPAIRGQKEVPLLRPAEVKPKEQWPVELEMAEVSFNARVNVFSCHYPYQLLGHGLLINLNHVLTTDRRTHCVRIAKDYYVCVCV